jgi:hypothetical protein
MLVGVSVVGFRRLLDGLLEDAPGRDRFAPLAGLVPYTEQLTDCCGSQVLTFPRDKQWPHIRREYLEENPRCAATSLTLDEIRQRWGKLAVIAVHHKIAVHKRPDLQLRKSNLIGLLECQQMPLHRILGHFGDFEKNNDEIERDAEEYRIGWQKAEKEKAA